MEEKTTEDDPLVEIPSVSPMSIRGTPMAKIESALSQTLMECHVRTEVENCLNSILLDVETTYFLSQELKLEANQQQVDRLTKQQKATVLEADAERAAREEQRLELADALVTDLMALSRELESLLQWKKQHEHKIETYDEVVAKLEQTKEELAVANRVSYGGGPKPRQPENAADSKEGNAERDTGGESETKDESIDSQEAAAVDTSEPEDPKPVVDEDKKPPAKGSTKPEAEEEKKLPAETVVETMVAEVPPAASGASSGETTDNAVVEEPAAAVVLLDDGEEEEEVPGLVEIDIEILMSIFGFLDAIDILNTAQINISMYSRVDNIFGISEDGQTPPAPPPKPAKKPPPPVAPQQPTTKPAAKPQVAVAANMPEASKKPPATSADSSGPLGLGLLAMLQPKPAAPATPTRSAASRGSTMNAAVAQSMASKLSDQELAAIISMTDKVSKMERQVVSLEDEKEELASKLEGTEAVKQFLIGKLRDVELKLNKSKDDEVKVTQQIASDQEVIAFLDSRVQELERSSENLTQDRDAARKELESIQVTSSKKITMLNDILKYEREKLKDEETEWKATKKVLVKEVKSCRAQIVALQAERDGYKEQNEMLKRAIVSTGKNPASSPSRPI